MLLKNVASQGVYLYAYTIATGVADTGDSANITGYFSLDDGTATVFATANPTELSATHMKGVYWQPLAQSETNGNHYAYSWASSTAGIAIVPMIGFTSGVNLPTAVAGAAGGLFIAGTNAATVITTSLTTHLIGTVDTCTTVTNQLTAAAIATGVWQDATGSDFTTASSIGKSLYTTGAVPGAAGGLFIAGTNAATVITTSLTTHFVGTVDTVTTYTGNTPQTGDAYARLGAPAGASIAADIAEIEGETDTLVAGVVLTSAGLDSIVIETSLNARQALSIIAAATAGTATGVDTGSPVYKGAGVNTTRITATAASGNRSAVTLAPPA